MIFSPKARIALKNIIQRVFKGASVCLMTIQVLLVALPGIYFMCSGFYDVYCMAASNDWPSTTGEVTAKYRNNKNETHITYRYTVNGDVYHNSSISFADRPDETFLKNIEQGQGIKVYYSNRKFHESLLIPGMQWNLRTGISFLLGLLFAGIFFILIRSKSNKNKTDSCNTIDPVNWL